MKRKIVKKAASERPFHVKYYIDAHDMPQNWARQGHCKREDGVIKGAYVRIFLKQYAVARVYKDGVNILTIRPDKHGMPVASFGPHRLGMVLANGRIDYRDVA